MTLTEKFANLTPGQREKFNALKDSAGLDTFLSETGLELTVEEKTQVLEYIASGKLPIADEELENVAGGGCGGGSGPPDKCSKCGSTEIKSRTSYTNIGPKRVMQIFYYCCHCGSACS